jgi:hypothetical protein
MDRRKHCPKDTALLVRREHSLLACKQNRSYSLTSGSVFDLFHPYFLLNDSLSARYMPRSKDAGADMNRMEHEVLVFLSVLICCLDQSMTTNSGQAWVY